MSNIRRGITVLIIYLILAAIPAVVCAAANEASYKRLINENYNGKIILIKKGDTIYLKLKENPSTGYSWQLDLSKGLNTLSTKYYPPESSQNDQRFIVGAAGFRLWGINSIAKGSQQVKGIYKRSWERETGKEQTFTLNVEVI